MSYRETAQEQFQQQVGTTTPTPLPAPDKHFDPNKSATLRYLKVCASPTLIGYRFPGRRSLQFRG